MRAEFNRCSAMVTSDLSLVRSIVRFGVTSARVDHKQKERISMCRKLFVVVVSILMLCPSVEASTFTFGTPAAGTIWSSAGNVTAFGTTTAGGATGVRVNFGYYDGITEIVENYSNVMTMGPVAGPSTWSAVVTPPWAFLCLCYRWKKDPTNAGPPPMLVKNHFVRVNDNPATVPPGGAGYRNDQGVF